MSIGALLRKTATYGFNIINFNFARWHTYEQENWDLLDSIFAAYISSRTLKGLWQNSTAYAVNDRVIDDDVNKFYICQVNHTSAASPTTFAQNRTSNPTYWRAETYDPVNRGEWASGVLYNTNDFITYQTKIAVAKTNYTSGVSYAADIAANNLSELFDANVYADSFDSLGNIRRINGGFSPTEAATGDTNYGGLAGLFISNVNSVVSMAINEVGGNTNYPTALTGAGILRAQTDYPVGGTTTGRGGYVCGINGHTFLLAPGIAVNEMVSTNRAGAPTTALPPDRSLDGVGSSKILANVLTISSLGGPTADYYDASIGINIAPTTGYGAQIFCGIYAGFNADDLTKHANTEYVLFADATATVGPPKPVLVRSAGGSSYAIAAQYMNIASALVPVIVTLNSAGTVLSLFDAAGGGQFTGLVQFSSLSATEVRINGQAGDAASPSNGWLIYNTALHKARLRENGAWKSVITEDATAWTTFGPLAATLDNGVGTASLSGAYKIEAANPKIAHVRMTLTLTALTDQPTSFTIAGLPAAITPLAGTKTSYFGIDQDVTGLPVQMRWPSGTTVYVFPINGSGDFALGAASAMYFNGSHEV